MVYADTGILEVLVIDDDPDLRGLLSQLLLAEGHQVVACESAEQGLEHLPVNVFDVALLDHQLPGMEGLLFGEYLRRNNPDMAIALVTGAGDDRIRRLVADHGIRLIEKPFEPEQIMDFVDAHRAALDRARKESEARAAPTFAPPVAAHAAGLADYFDIPSVPQRLADRLTQRVRNALAIVRMEGPAAERDRVAAFSGLLAARVLGLDLPRNRAGETLWEEYDRLMQAQGRRPEFG